MSLKRTAMKMAIAFAAAKGYEQLQKRGGLRGVRDRIAGGGAGSGGLDGLLGSLAGGGGTGRGAAGGLGALLGTLGGSTRGSSGMGGLLGGLAAMAGGAAGGVPEDHAMEMAEKGPQDEDTARAMIRAIGQAVRADGEIDAEEDRALHEIMGQMETDEDRAALDAALREPVDPESLARDVPIGHEQEVYAAALTAIDPDRRAEMDYLARFAAALRLSTDSVAELHRSAGKAV